MSLINNLRLKLLLRSQQPSYQDEIEYWDDYLSTTEPLLFDEEIKQKAFPIYMREIASGFREAYGSIPQVLEIGSGPVSILASGVEKKEIEVSAIDPLAEIYSDLLKKYEIVYPVRPILGHSENIGKHFPPSTFDIVYSSNALDHALSPGLCLREIVCVTKLGGYVYLEGFTNEGSNGNWHGLHQHDLYLDDDHLMHKTKSGRIANLTLGLGLKCLMAETCQFKDREILSFGYEIPKKIKPENNWNFRDWYTIVFQKAI